MVNIITKMMKKARRVNMDSKMIKDNTKTKTGRGTSMTRKNKMARNCLTSLVILQVWNEREMMILKKLNRHMTIL